MTSKLLSLCHLDQLLDGQAQGFDPFDLGRDVLFVVRQGHDLHAYRNDCPHWPGSAMAWKKDAYLCFDRAHIMCHGHGAKFDIASGKCVSGPCVGQSLQPLVVCVDESGHVSISFERTNSDYSR